MRRRPPSRPLFPRSCAGATTTTTAQQMAVYEEFAARICGFKPFSADEHLSDFSGSKANATTLSDKELEVFVAQIGIVVREVTTMLSARDPQPTNKGYQAVVAMRDSLSQLAAAPRDPVQLYNAVLRAVEQLLFAYQVDPATRQSSDWVLRAGELFVGFCRILQALMPLHELQRKVTAIILSNRMDSRYNVDAMEFLYKHQLLLCAEYDAFLAQLMDGGGNLQASIFAQRLIKAMSTSDHPLASHEVLRRNFPRVIEELRKIQQMQMGARPTPTTDTPVGFPQQAGSKDAQNGWPEAARPEGVPDDQPELQGKVEMILREWISLCYTPMAQREPQQALATMIHMMHEQGVLSNDEMITRFFRLCTEMCVDVSYRLLKVQNEQGQNSTVTRQRCYYTLDAFVKLTCLMVKHSDGSQHQTKINLLKKVLNIVTSVLHNDHQLRRNEFQAMPYHRILIIMFNELTAPDPALEPIAWNILEAFGQALFILQPRRVPGFTYAWLDIVGHRNVIARLLGENCDGLRTGAMYTQLIICHLKFLAPFLRNIQLPKTVAVLYKGTLRVLLVILHDFPELLCEYHYVICDAIPPNCVQLRNLVLSAYPRNMRLPDPFALNFKQIDAIAEMGEEPKNHISMTTIIPPELRAQLDVYLTSRSPVEFLSTLPSLLQVSQTPGSKYNTTVMNAVVLYVGIRAIGNLHERGQRISMTTIAHNAYMDIFQNLAVQLCTEGRYLLFNAIANQLRYPNAHTHYFSCTFLFLFLHADSPAIQEQITRILFERLVALRPHPWGLLITFIELIKNPTYNFWRHEFTRCAPEIERLFQNVANTCVSNTTATQRAGAALAAAAGGSEAK